MNRMKAIAFIACVLLVGLARAQSSACDAVLVKTDVKYLTNDVLRLAYSYFLNEKTFAEKKQSIEGWYGEIGGTFEDYKKNMMQRATGMKLDLTQESARAFLQTGLPAEAIQEWGRCMENQLVTLRIRELDDAGATIDFWYRPGPDPQKLLVQVFPENLKPLPKGLVPATALGKVTIPLAVKRIEEGEQSKLTIKVGNFGDNVTLPPVPQSCGQSTPQELALQSFARYFCFGGQKTRNPSTYRISFTERMLVTKVTVDAHDWFGGVHHAKLVLRFDGKNEGKKVKGTVREDGLEVPDELGELIWTPNREAGHIDLVSKQRNDYPGGEETCLYKVRVEGYPARGAACPAQQGSKAAAEQKVQKTPKK